MKNLTQESVVATVGPYLKVEFDNETHGVWVSMIHPERPCMTTGLVEQVRKVQREVEQLVTCGHRQGLQHQWRYQVLASARPGVFNLGGDLAYFIDTIRRRDRAQLYHYAKTCIDVLHPTATGYGQPFTTIALVQGEALGGGFEAALAARVLIAEEGAVFGFPETLFGMFPGMGAFSFLARRLSPALAKRLITSGKLYPATELYDLGVVDVLAEPGRGREAVLQYMRHQDSRARGFWALDKLMDQRHPVTYQELSDGVELWVDTAMGLSEKNLRLMEFLLNAQHRRWAQREQTPSPGLVEAV